MWVSGTLKDQLGLGHRKKRKTSSLGGVKTSESNLEAAPILMDPHNRSMSELNGYAPPSPRPPSSPLLAESHEMVTRGPAPQNLVISNKNVDNGLLTPNTYVDSSRAAAVSPQPSYYSASEIPPPSPLPSPKYRYPDGEVTSSPPPVARRTSQASRLGASPHAPPNAPLPPQPQAYQTPSTAPSSYQPPPEQQQYSAYLQPHSGHHRTGTESSVGSLRQFGHGYDRSGSSASYASNVSYATAEEEPPWERQSNNPYQGYALTSDNDPYGGVTGRDDDDGSTVQGHGNQRGNNSDPRASVASTWEGGRAL